MGSIHGFALRFGGSRSQLLIMQKMLQLVFVHDKITTYIVNYNNN